MNKRIREYGIIIGDGRPGSKNKITDVPGVKVGHVTLDDEEHKTGVTVILPCEDNPFINKLTAAVYIHNGFGKSQGLVQIEELGTLETPIALTNTLNVGKVHDALTGYMIERCEADQVTVSSVNPVVGECNDSALNRIQKRVIGEPQVRQAILNAGVDFEEGDVGAGKGTVCFGLKGGIGSASRIIEYDGREYVIGSLVQTNFGAAKSLRINGKQVGKTLADRIEASKTDQGSVMIIIATNLPVSDRQLKRIIKRAGVGLSRCGSDMGHGSGDIVVGFTTANRIPFKPDQEIIEIQILEEAKLERAFTAAAEATEEAILNSLAMAHTVTGYRGTVKYCLTDLYLNGLDQL
ncbi:S58 family peptidase [Clostridium sp. MCC353]|nr:P1 family peptidase [Clostridium sp. MCC353]MBT9779838.1 S58 family peptidase [Clostridium sp. MCC353]